jgi:hypothetical protein
VQEVTPNWQAAITGDMTLSILDDKGKKVLGVDMLHAKTMLAGTDGERLERTMNDLQAIADIVSKRIPDLSEPLSPRPWNVSQSGKMVRVKDREVRTIAEHKIPEASLPTILQSLQVVVDHMNAQ